MKDDNCIFCKLANGVFPTNSIYEDEDFNVILDASPATKGHALILPKEHYANMFEIDDDILAKAAKLAKKIMTHEKEILGCDGYNLVQNNGEAAGQTVFHFHMHLIPRYSDNNESKMINWKPNEFSDEEMKDICDKMKM
ncbi:MAG: HIT domain-containing protein [Agathobacter sp.]|nr:HIT domain-containing protein [Agathobacter sp.]MDY3797456.1 HIT domain-containing protein [Agathobacter sp.]